MDLLQLFYLAAIVFMLLTMLLLIGLVVLLVILKNKIAALRKDIANRFSSLHEVKADANNIAYDAGMLLSDVIGKRLR
jgi:hypothetical protein